THRVSASFRWGRKVAAATTERPAPEDEDQAPIPEKAAPKPKVNWGESILPFEAAPVKQVAAKDTPEAHFARARRFIEERAYPSALLELDKVEAMLGPDDRRRVLYYERLGAISLAKKETAKAKGYYTEGLKVAGSLGLSDLNVA